MIVDRRKSWRVEESQIRGGGLLRPLAQRNVVVRELLLTGESIQVGNLLENVQLEYWCFQ